MAKIRRTKIRAIFDFWSVFAPKTAFLADFVIIEGISILFYQPKWMKIGILHQLSGQTRKKTVRSLLTQFWAKNGPFLPKNCVFGWFWDNWRHLYIFYYQKWMVLGVLHKFLKLKEIKPVLDPLDSFLGQKWPIFGPKTAHFWSKNGQLLAQKLRFGPIWR